MLLVQGYSWVVGHKPNCPTGIGSDSSLILSRSPRRFGEGFEVFVVVLPGGVHHAVDMVLRAGLSEPVADGGGVGVVVTGEELVVAAVAEEGEAFLGGTVVPVDERDVRRQPFP